MRRIWNVIVGQFRTLESLPEYVLSVKKEAWNIAWGDGLLAVTFVLYWSVVPMSERTIALYFVGAVIIAGYYIWRADHLRLVPRVSVEFRNGEPCTVMTYTNDFRRQRLYVRVAVKCISGTSRCAGELVAVFKEVDGRWEALNTQSFPLVWGDLNLTGQIDIESGITRVLDIFYIEEDAGRETIVPCVHPLPLRLLPVFQERDIVVRFDISVSGAEPISLRAQLGTRWDHPSVQQIPYEKLNSN